MAISGKKQVQVIHADFAELKSILKTGDTILVKGSRRMKMEEIVGSQNKRAMEMADPIQEEQNNFRKLQNLGQEELPTDGLEE